MPRFGLRSRLVGVGRRGTGRLACRGSLHSGLPRAVALPRDLAQGTPELGALALDGDQLPLGVCELLLEAPAVVAGDAELVVAVPAVEPFPTEAERGADVQFGGGEADGERQQEHHGGEDADDDRVLGEDGPAFENGGAGGLVEEQEALDALAGVQGQQDRSRDQGDDQEQDEHGLPASPAATPGGRSIHGSARMRRGGHLEALVPERAFDAAVDAAVVVAHRRAQEGGLGAHGEIPVPVARCLQAVDQPDGAFRVVPGGGLARGGGRLDGGGIPRACPNLRFARTVEDELFDRLPSPVVIVAVVAAHDPVEGRVVARREVERQPAAHLKYSSVICGRKCPSSWLTTSSASS